MSVDPIVYEGTNKRHPSLDAVQELKNSKTGTQNRPYPPETLMVVATIHKPEGGSFTWEFDWNDRESVRRFAADSDRAIRSGSWTTLKPRKVGSGQVNHNGILT